VGINVDLKTDVVDKDVDDDALADIQRTLGANEKGVYSSACFFKCFHFPRLGKMTPTRSS